MSMPTSYLREKGRVLAFYIDRLNNMEEGFVDPNGATVEGIRQMAVALITEIEQWRSEDAHPDS